MVQTSVLPFTWIALRQAEVDWSRVLKWAAFGGVAAIVLFFKGLAATVLEHGWSGISDYPNGMGMTVAYLLPFPLAALALVVRGGHGRRIAEALFVIAMLAALVINDSRTEVLMALVVVAVLLAFRIPLRWTLGAVILIFPLLLTLMHSEGRGMDQSGTDWYSIANRFTANRVVLWHGAIEHPPENVWTGAGLHNVRFYIESFSGAKVKHLHNLFLDTWYDAGWLGLGALLGLLGWLTLRALGGLVDAARRAGRVGVQASAPWIAGAAAAGVTLMLDHSYSSLSFAIFLMFALPVIVRLGEEGAS